MSAALHLPVLWETESEPAAWPAGERSWNRNRESAGRHESGDNPAASAPLTSLAFYRQRTENLLRRYLYTSMQVGRTPAIAGQPVERGRASYRNARTFEDAIIFVLDVERCLGQIDTVDRQLISRIALQEYTQTETAALLGMSVRAVHYKYPEAVDRLTEKLLTARLMPTLD